MNAGAAIHPTHPEWSVYDNLTQSELIDLLYRIACRNPYLEPYLDAALEKSLRFPPDLRRSTLTGYLTMLAKQAFLNDHRKKPNLSIDTEFTSASDTLDGSTPNEFLSFLEDPTTQQEFETAEKERKPLVDLEWLRLARMTLIARQFADARNKFGKAEHGAWARRSKILDLFVALAEGDEYDAPAGAVLHWMKKKLEECGICVEQNTVANDLVTVRTIVAEYVEFVTSRSRL